MSRVGKKPIEISSDVQVLNSSGVLTVKGKLGELKHRIPEEISVVVEGQKVLVTIANQTKTSRANWGTTRSIIQNMVEGVSKGFRVSLLVKGVGYRCAVKGKILGIFAGLSHEIKMEIDPQVTVNCPKPTVIEITGFNKDIVNSFAAKVKHVHNNIRTPEPYKGKGIMYIKPGKEAEQEPEDIVRKEGKKK